MDLAIAKLYKPLTTQFEYNQPLAKNSPGPEGLSK